MHNLTHTSWLLINREDNAGWTIYPGIMYPADILNFEEYHIHNRALTSENTSILPYSWVQNEIDLGEGKWEIESRTEHQLVLTCRSQRFIYQLISSGQDEPEAESQNLEKRLLEEKWFIEGAFEEMEANICLFLKEKLDFGKYLPHQYFTWIRIGYHRDLRKRSESLVSGWKVVQEGSAHILSLFDRGWPKNLLLTEETEDLLVFKGKQELRLRKAQG